MKRLLSALAVGALVASLGASTAFATHGDALFVDSIDGQGAGNFVGSLDNSIGDTSDWYCFSGAAGTAVTIAMSAEFDTFLILYSTPGVPAAGDERATYTEVTSNDDAHPGTLNSLIETSLPTTGNYMVAAGSLSNPEDALGDYALSVEGNVSPCEAVLSLDDTAQGNADRVRVTGTFICPAGEVFLVQVTLTQDGTSGSGRARGTCTGEAQAFSAGVVRNAGPGFTPGAATACAVASSGIPGSGTVNTQFETCEAVTLVS